MKFAFSQQIFGKVPNIKVSSKSVQWEPSCFMQRDRQTDEQADMTNIIVAFRNFANAPTKGVKLTTQIHLTSRLKSTWICTLTVPYVIMAGFSKYE
jgi:hypothetical protein